VSVYMHHVETTLTDDQYELLVVLSEQSGRSIEELIRDAIVQAYGADPGQARRLAALEQLLSLDLPVIPEEWQVSSEERSQGVEVEPEPPTGIALLDADVCVHAAAPSSPAWDACAWVMSEIAHNRLNAAIDVEVVREIMDALRRVDQREKAYLLVDALMQIVPIHHPISSRDIQLAVNLCRMKEVQRIRSSGCIHLAVMQHNGLNCIISLDPGYDDWPDVVRLNPFTLHAVAAK